jgi:hypothetical protein
MKQSSRIILAIILCVTVLGMAASISLLVPSSVAYEKYEIVTARIVRPGVTYYLVVDKRGPWRIQVLEIDLTQTDLEISAIKALDQLLGRETTSSMAKRVETSARTVVAALNADFFSLATGEIENNLVIDGDFVKGTKMTGSPFDTFDNIHSQFVLSSNRKPFLARLAFAGRVYWNQSGVAELSGVNIAPQSNSLVMFNHYFGPSTPTDTIKMAIQELVLQRLAEKRDTTYAVVTGKTNAGGSTIGSGSFVLSGYNLEAPNIFSASKVGDTLKVWLGTSPYVSTPKTLVGGWPRIVLNGSNIGPYVDTIEGTFPSFSAQRNPRSGVGFSKDSTTMYLVAIDGRQKASAGMTLTEFADLMISLGIYQGLNLDGGGSTTFVLEGKIMNLPSDASGERPVGNCLVLLAPRRN